MEVNSDMKRLLGYYMITIKENGKKNLDFLGEWIIAFDNHFDHLLNDKNSVQLRKYILTY